MSCSWSYVGVLVVIRTQIRQPCLKIKTGCGEGQNRQEGQHVTWLRIHSYCNVGGFRSSWDKWRLVPEAPRVGGRGSEELTRCSRGKETQTLHWFQYCMTWTVVASNFSPFHQQMGPDELHFMWDDSTLPWTYLIWFVLSLTLIRPSENGTLWRLIYVPPDVLVAPSLACRVCFLL